jgi:hypothetical protein
MTAFMVSGAHRVIMPRLRVKAPGRRAPIDAPNFLRWSLRPQATQSDRHSRSGSCSRCSVLCRAWDAWSRHL